MKFSLALLALVPAVALAAPLEPRQGGVSVNCGGVSYTSTQVNRAINNGLSGKYSSSGYPHTYNNYEGFDFSDYCDGPYKEYPLKTSSTGYTGGSPGADRVVYDSNDGTFCGAVSIFLAPTLFSDASWTLLTDDPIVLSLLICRSPTPAPRATTSSSATTKRTSAS
ncbi:hypothetical protein L1887_57090 [Cichorium endivia]|nr:hypothetical protein L1887_57090 [Cichorium endivia]